MARLAVLAVVALLLQGCTNVRVMSHVPLSTLSRLSALKLAEIDPSDLRVAARMPALIEPRKEGVKVTLVIGSGRGSTAEYTLEAVTEPQELIALAQHQRPDRALWVYRLAQQDVLRLRQMIARTNSGGGGVNVSISAGVAACHRSPLGTSALPTTTLLRVNAEGYLVLTQELDLRSLVSAAALATEVLPCVP